MHPGFEAWNSFWIWLLRNSGYGAVLVLLVLGVQWVFRNQLTARWRFGLWWLVLLRLAIPTLPESPASIFNLAQSENAALSTGLSTVEKWGEGSTVNFSRGNAQIAENQSPTTEYRPQATQAAAIRAEPGTMRFVRQTLPAIWGVGVLLLAGRVAYEQIRWKRQARGFVLVTQSEVLKLIESCRHAMGIRSSLQIFETRAVCSPGLHGVFRPRLLLPAGFTTRFGLQDLRYIFLHELAHVKRRDMAVNWLVTLLQILHWFNPFVWLAFHRMRADRELACDALALSVTQPGENHAYGQTIVRLLESFVQPSTSPGFIGILEPNGEIKQRIVWIARFKKASQKSILGILILAVLGVITLTNARSKSLVEQTVPEIKEGGMVSGNVVDDRGAPLQGVQVIQNGKMKTHTDKDGRFSFTNVPADARYLFNKDSFFAVRDQVLSTNTGDNTIVMRGEVEVTCRVVDAATLKPITSLWLVPGRKYSNGERTQWNWEKWTGGTNGTVTCKLSAPTISISDDTQKLMVGAPEYTPVITADIDPKQSKQTMELRLSKSQRIQGIVLQPDGQPAKWADVFLWEDELNLGDIPKFHRRTTDATGTFSFEPSLARKVIVYHLQGFAALTPETLHTSPRITLHRGGVVAGVARLGGKPAANQTIVLGPLHYNNQISIPHQFAPSEEKTDDNGNFVITSVPEGEYWIGFKHSIEDSLDFRSRSFLTSHNIPIAVNWGKTNQVVLGGSGRTLIGQLTIGQVTAEPAWEKAQGMLTLRLPDVLGLPDIPVFANTYSTQGKQTEATQAFWRSEAGKARTRAARQYVPSFNADGSFRIEDIPAGRYQLTITVPTRLKDKPRRIGNTIILPPIAGKITREIHVPSKPPGGEEKPIDVGVLTL